MKKTLLASAVSAFVLLGCTEKNQSPEAGLSDAKPEIQEIESATAAEVNPLLTEWKTDFGVPPFNLIQDSHYEPAFEAAFEAHKAEIAEILADTAEPTFANTIEALERSGSSLTRVSNVFYAVNGAHSNDVIRDVAKRIAPKMSAHLSDITLNEALFKRVNAVYQQSKDLGLNAEQTRLLENTYKQFVRAGANLSETDKQRVREIDSRLSELSQQFGQNVLKETNEFIVIVDKLEDIEDLPQSLINAAADLAAKNDAEGKWAFNLARPSINPVLQYSSNRELRKKLFEGYAMRGNNGNAEDNKAIASEMAALRVERANIMGHDNHASFVLERNVAENPENVMGLLDKIWPAALQKAELEAADLQAALKADTGETDLQGWDWRYYTEKVRKAKYDLDENELRPYFEVNIVRDGVFDTANKLFGLTFTERNDLPKWHESQQVFEVKEANGDHIGIVYFDYFARDSKRGGAWMNHLRKQSNLDGYVHPIVTNNFNYPPASEGSPSLLSLSEAETFFHEFGHALHGLLSDVTYESLSGTSTPRDFVEFPSQVFENWMTKPEVLKGFAKHYETGEPIPDALIEKINKASQFNQGFATVEYLGAALLDMSWHTLESTDKPDALALEEAAMARIGMIDEIIPRYRSTYFNHIFAGGYSSGYYSYIWSEIMDADAFAAFEETSLFDQETAQKYREHILSKGGTKPGMDLYIDFRGRKPEIKPLLVKRGLE
ncbi:M3 family metallopeptidase [Biformimicrobium ophioploci]|nr:M3 family metallopeptidase [Microbulbifer sp. NKW57]